MAVNSLASKSPQQLRIFTVRSWKREDFLGVKWRRRRCWEPTLSACKLLILLSSHFDRVRIPRVDPQGFSKITPCSAITVVRR